MAACVFSRPFGHPAGLADGPRPGWQPFLQCVGGSFTARPISATVVAGPEGPAYGFRRGRTLQVGGSVSSGSSKGAFDGIPLSRQLGSQGLCSELRLVGHVRAADGRGKGRGVHAGGVGRRVNFFDNAEAYAAGVAEEIMGKILKKKGWKRSDYVVSTKIFWGGEGPNDRGLSRKHIVEGTDAALRGFGSTTSTSSSATAPTSTPRSRRRFAP